MLCRFVGINRRTLIDDNSYYSLDKTINKNLSVVFLFRAWRHAISFDLFTFDNSFSVTIYVCLCFIDLKYYHQSKVHRLQAKNLFSNFIDSSLTLNKNICQQRTKDTTLSKALCALYIKLTEQNNTRAVQSILIIVLTWVAKLALVLKIHNCKEKFPLLGCDLLHGCIQYSQPSFAGCSIKAIFKIRLSIL